jgi:hypothetical protein
MPPRLDLRFLLLRLRLPPLLFGSAGFGFAGADSVGADSVGAASVGADSVGADSVGADSADAASFGADSGGGASAAFADGLVPNALVTNEKASDTDFCAVVVKFAPVVSAPFVSADVPVDSAESFGPTPPLYFRFLFLRDRGIY